MSVTSKKYAHQVLVNCLFKLFQEKVWLPTMTIAVDLGHKATKQTNKYDKCHLLSHSLVFGPARELQQILPDRNP